MGSSYKPITEAPQVNSKYLYKISRFTQVFITKRWTFMIVVSFITVINDTSELLTRYSRGCIPPQMD